MRGDALDGEPWAASEPLLVRGPLRDEFRVSKAAVEECEAGATSLLLLLQCFSGLLSLGTSSFIRKEGCFHFKKRIGGKGQRFKFFYSSA